MAEMTNLRGAVQIVLNAEVDLNLRFGKFIEEKFEEEYEDDFFFANGELVYATILDETEEAYNVSMELNGHDSIALSSINKNLIKAIEKE